MSLLEIESLRVHYATPHGTLRAVDGVSLSIEPGETLGLVGESGCGKSTLGRAIIGLVPLAGGSIRLAGRAVHALARAERRALTRSAQIVFQDPFAALNPRAPVGRIIAEPLVVHGIGTPEERRRRVAELLVQVGLDPEAAGRLPHEFSGGQRQRIGIARALALEPELLVCDEPVSALDASVQAQVINLFADLQASLGLAYLFISHDLAVVRHVSHRIAVMYLGRIVETGPAETLFERAAHPYTRALIEAAPRLDAPAARTAPLEGDVPSALAIPGGCRFHTRCPIAAARCRTEEPALEPRADGRRSACHFDRG